MCADAWRWQKGNPDGYGVKDQEMVRRFLSAHSPEAA
jgi:hypothetical protein